MLLNKEFLRELSLYLDQESVLRLLTTCKPMNMLLKESLVYVKSDKSDVFRDYPALREAIFFGHQIDAYPPGLTSLDIWNFNNTDLIGLPKTLAHLKIQSLVFCEDSGDGVDIYIDQSVYVPTTLTSLDVQCFQSTDQISHLVNLESLSVKFFYDECTNFSLPKTLTNLKLGSDDYDADKVNVRAALVWPALPETLKSFSMVIGFDDDADVRMRDLPKGLTSLSIHGQNLAFDDDDSLNPGLLSLSTDMLMLADFKMLPASLTRLETETHEPFKLVLKGVPPSVTHLTVVGAAHVAKFDKNFPKNIKTLRVMTRDIGRMKGCKHLPRTMTELSFGEFKTSMPVAQRYSWSSGSVTTTSDEIKNLPPALKTLAGVKVESSRRMHLDLSQFKSLTKMKQVHIDFSLVTLPENLITFKGFVHPGVTFPDNLRKLILRGSNFSSILEGDHHWIENLPKTLRKLEANRLEVSGDFGQMDSEIEIAVFDKVVTSRKYSEVMPLIFPRMWCFSSSNLDVHTHLDGSRWVLRG